MKRERRQKIIKKRKNFLPTVIVTILLWLFLALVIYFIDPGTFGAIPLLFILIFTASLFTFSVIFDNLRRGIITGSAITIFVVLRYFGVGNILNLLLIIGIATVIELYFWYTSER